MASSSQKISVVTGGAGFLGSHLTDRLLAEGHRVIAIDNLITGNLKNIGHLAGNENFAFINTYLASMGPVIRTHDGFIDKYIGDAIMALFDTADDALRAGLAMFDTLGTRGLRHIRSS